jgi:hypothetical protein
MVTSTILFIRKEDKIVLRRYVTTQPNKYFVKKEIEFQLNRLLNTYIDLERKDIVIREYTGVTDTNEVAS